MKKISELGALPKTIICLLVVFILVILFLEYLKYSMDAMSSYAVGIILFIMVLPEVLCYICMGRGCLYMALMDQVETRKRSNGNAKEYDNSMPSETLFYITIVAIVLVGLFYFSYKDLRQYNAFAKEKSTRICAQVIDTYDAHEEAKVKGKTPRFCRITVAFNVISTQGVRYKKEKDIEVGPTTLNNIRKSISENNMDTVIVQYAVDNADICILHMINPSEETRSKYRNGVTKVWNKEK